MGFPSDASGKELSCRGRRHERGGFDFWVGKIPWKRAWKPILLENNTKDKGAWWVTVHVVAENQTRLKRLSTHCYFKAEKFRA